MRRLTIRRGWQEGRCQPTAPARRLRVLSRRRCWRRTPAQSVSKTAGGIHFPRTGASGSEGDSTIRISIGKHGRRRRRLGTHGDAIPSQEQDGRRLAGVIGGLPVPGAGRIGGTEGGLHRAAQDGGIDAPAAFEIGQKLPRSPYDSGGNNCGGTHRERRGTGAADERFGHGRMSFGERERVEPPGALLNRRGSNPSRPRSSS